MELAGPRCGDPGSHRYRYRLEGFDDAWIGGARLSVRLPVSRV